MGKIKLTILAILLGSINIMAQDPIFLQPLETNVNLNPALVGNDSVARLNLIYRNQWPNLAGNFVTPSVNFYQYFPKLNAYAGINCLNDNQARGTLISNNVSIFYSQNINIKQVLFRPSLEIAYGDRKLNTTKITFGDIIDGRYGSVWPVSQPLTPYKKYVDFNIGTVAYYKKLLVGFSIHHLNQPDIGMQGTYQIPITYGLQFGYHIMINKIVLSPYAIYIKQQNYQSLLIGANALLLNHLNVGLSYRTLSSIICNVGYQNKFFKINYSYDATSAKNLFTPAGSHELYLSFRLNSLRL